MTDFRKNVYKFIAKHCLIGTGERLLVGVSGGIDSVVLLAVLSELAGEHNWKLAVAHFNHTLRGVESDGDEEFVKQLAKNYGIEFFSEREMVSERAKTDGVSIEMAARDLRHHFFVRSAEKFRAHKIALAHHLDDQIELFFLRMLRGAGGRGLGGMSPIAPSAFDKKLILIRPFLGISKDEISNFAKVEKLSFREDCSNRENQPLRNRVRIDLLPFVRKHFGNGFEATIPRVMETIAGEHGYVREMAEKWASRKEIPFTELHTAVARQVLVQQLRENQIEPEFALVEYLLNEPGRAISISSEISVLRRVEGELVFSSNEGLPKSNFNETVITLDSDSGQIIFNDVAIRWARADTKPTEFGQTGIEWFDAAKLGSSIRLRHWRDGDRMQPIGMDGTVKLQDLFVNGRIPQFERRRCVVAENERGEIFWVEGLRISEQVKLADQTGACLKWNWERKN